MPFADEAHFPNVDVYAEKGSGLETLVGLGLTDLTVGQLVTDTTEFITRDGDVNQEDLTNDAVGAWAGMDCWHFSLTDNPGVNHFELPATGRARPADRERERAAVRLRLTVSGRGLSLIAGLRRPDGVGAGKPLGVEPRAAVDRSQRALAGACREAGARQADGRRHGRHRPRPVFRSGTWPGRTRPRRPRHRVPVQLRPDARAGMHKDHRERHLAVFGAHELVRVLGVVEVVELDDRASLIGQRSLPSPRGRPRKRRR